VISYLDTSLLVKLYIQEADSALALQLLRRVDMEPMISRLSEIEMATALLGNSSRAFGTRPHARFDLAYSKFRLRRLSGFYQLAEIDDAAFDLARSLGERYGAELGLRALDILHVATAMRAGATGFGTFDTRQAKLAQAVGLKILV
jgi:predicted nucleic acid-binding protein